MLGDLSTNFWKWEFRCPCEKCKRKKVKVSTLLLFKLEMLRMELGNKSMTIVSGNRCKEYNKKICGYSNSKHVPNPDGEAADIKVKDMKSITVGLAAEKVGGMRIGVGNDTTHLDISPPSPSKYWIYESSIIYSAKIENESLLKFYEIIKKGDA